MLFPPVTMPERMVTFCKEVSLNIEANLAAQHDRGE
jgi:hypothetical protein